MKYYVKPNMPPLRWGYRAITLWPFGIFFSHIDYMYDAKLINHEQIHWAQQKEMAGILFYVWYGIEYLVRLIQLRSHWWAYKNISFEREAYGLEKVDDYLEWRRRYTWKKFLKA